jgi:hypothetical protein
MASQIGALATASPGEARAKIVAAFREAGCCVMDAAVLLGVNQSTLRNLVAKLDLSEKLHEIERRARGTSRHHGRLGGWPKGRKRK